MATCASSRRDFRGHGDSAEERPHLRLAGSDGSEPAAIIDENLARQYWPGENPLGQHIRNGTRPWATIVGLVGHVYANDLASDTGKGVYYYCLFQQPLPMASLV